MGKLTKAQREVLERFNGDDAAYTKSAFPSSDWVRIDVLRSYGLLTRRSYGFYSITEAGRLALSHQEPTCGEGK